MIGEKKYLTPLDEKIKVLFLEMEKFNFIVWKTDVKSNIGKKACSGLLTNLLREELDPKKKHLQDAQVKWVSRYTSQPREHKQFIVSYGMHLNEVGVV